jgi:hypothetical protein
MTDLDAALLLADRPPARRPRAAALPAVPAPEAADAPPLAIGGARPALPAPRQSDSPTVSCQDAVDAAASWRLPGAPATLGLYGRTLRRFEWFCAAEGLAPCPAAPATIVRFLQRRSLEGATSHALRLDARAIRLAHDARGLADPTDDPAVRAVLGIKPRGRAVARATAGAVVALVQGLAGNATPAPAPPAHDGPLSLAEIDAAVERFKLASLARGTREGYAGVLIQYSAFCDRFGLAAMPATSETVCRFLADYGLTRGVGSVNTARAAIRWIHFKAKQLSPTDHADVVELVKGYRRLRGAATDQKRALTSEEIIELCREMDEEGGLHALRDKAMTLLGFAGAFRRSEYTCAKKYAGEDAWIWFDLGDVSFNRNGVRILLRRSKTDQQWEGQEVFVTYGTNRGTCAVLALRNWLAAMKARGIATGPVFRPLQPRGDQLVGDATILDRPLTSAAFVLRLKHWAKRIGLDPASIAGHSLRAGHVTAASAGGASIFSIARQGRWTNLKTVLRYWRQTQAHVDNSSSALGL